MAFALSYLQRWFTSHLLESPTLEEQLWQATRDNNLPIVKDLLGLESIDLNQSNTFGIAPVHLAASKGHVALVKEFLRHPRVHVNQETELGATPFALACQWGQVEVVKLLLQDPRVRVNTPDSIRATPLWWAAKTGHEEVVRWMIAGRRVLAVDAKGGFMNTTACAEAEKAGHEELAMLLRRFKTSPWQTLLRVRSDLGLNEVLAARLFALGVFLSDEYLRIASAPPWSSRVPVEREDNKGLGGNGDQRDCEAEEKARTVRFFCVLARLPMELQSLVCLRVYGSSKDLIPRKQGEEGFREVVRMLHTGSNTVDVWCK